MAEIKYKFDDPKAAFAEAEERIQQAIESGATSLDLGQLGLFTVPASVSRLVNLQFLRIGSNRLSLLDESICRLTRLKQLRAGSNELTKLPESIGHLEQLEVLYLDSNCLTELPESIGQLTKLRSLHLYRNRLSGLPKSIQKLTVLKELLLQENDELGLPPGVVGSTFPGYTFWNSQASSPASILDYYFRVRAGKRTLNEAKLILLGRGEVGKTCLVNRLVHDKFASTSITRGISITQWPMTIGGDTVRWHVWDFGGQEIQHATHQFFLTERSLYLVVLNGRAGAEDEDAEYWLKFVKTFGASSPTIVY